MKVIKALCLMPLLSTPCFADDYSIPQDRGDITSYVYHEKNGPYEEGTSIPQDRNNLINTHYVQHGNGEEDTIIPQDRGQEL